MSKFDKYFLMEETDVLEYIQEKSDFFEKDANLVCKEIGDGNLNYVFRIIDQNTNKSVILKHSGFETRAKSGRIVDIDRSRIEAEILQKQNVLAPHMVPEVFFYDPIMCCTLMEDLKDYEVMRKSLLEGKIFPFFADQISSYMVDVLLPTTDIAMNHKEKKAEVKSFINPDLCNITEQLVYSESVANFSGKNSTTELSRDFVNKEVYENIELRREVAKMKFRFMENAQALLHGDLHSGSIFINDSDLRVFDVEFAFYGPIGYDVGNVLAHLIFALGHSEYTQKCLDKREDFKTWIKSAVKEIVDLFKVKFLKKFDEVATDEMAKTAGFKEDYLAEIIFDTASTTGIELLRRVVGVAKVQDITLIENEFERSELEKKLISLAKDYILNCKSYATGDDFVKSINKFF